MNAENMRTLAHSEMAVSASAGFNVGTTGHILMVDDDRAIRVMSGKVLLRSGYQVDTAEDGQAGWEALQANSYDLLITDNNTRRFSGVELVRRLRSAQMTLPVVLALGTLDTEELNRSPWLQVAASLLKPFTTDQLLEVVKEVLRATSNARTSGGVRLPLLTEAWRQVQPFPHWGLNE